MQELLNLINQLDYMDTGTPLTDADIASNQALMNEANLPAIPQEVLAFLKHYNGCRSEGRTLWGIDAKRHFVFDILGENTALSRPNPSEILLLGETETTYVGWLPHKKRYSIIDKASFMVLHNLNNFCDVVKYILKIND